MSDSADSCRTAEGGADRGGHFVTPVRFEGTHEDQGTPQAQGLSVPSAITSVKTKEAGPVEEGLSCGFEDGFRYTTNTNDTRTEEDTGRRGSVRRLHDADPTFCESLFVVIAAWTCHAVRGDRRLDLPRRSW
ncbi:hypothetical protein ACWDGI_01235 [Streptomyces sp. NPDC001220]